MKTLGSGIYFPRVYDFFPRTARGHGAQVRRKRFKADGTPYSHGGGPQCNPKCVEPTCELVSRTGRGQQHLNQAQNRKEWEESVGIVHSKRSTRGAAHQVAVAALAQSDPKGRTDTVIV
jgi:hypothetical protein